MASDGRPATPDAVARPAGIVARGWGWRYATRHAWAVQGVDLRIEPRWVIVVTAEPVLPIRRVTTVHPIATDGEAANVQRHQSETRKKAPHPRG